MVERRITEVELRQMLSEPDAIFRDVEPGRWVVEARLARRGWQIIVEPEPGPQLLVVVTAYALDWETMRDAYLEVTYRHGRPFGAYYYLPRKAGDAAQRTRRVEPCFVVDYAGDDRPIGIEIVPPDKASLQAFNDLLRELGQQPVESRALAPLHAA